jgi:hypothetical protein
MIAVTAEIPSVIGIAPPEIAVIRPEVIVISQATKAGSQLLCHEVTPFEPATNELHHPASCGDDGCVLPLRPGIRGATVRRGDVRNGAPCLTLWTVCSKLFAAYPCFQGYPVSR